MYKGKSRSKKMPVNREGILKIKKNKKNIKKENRSGKSE
jgi:hypothetical protein